MKFLFALSLLALTSLASTSAQAGWDNCDKYSLKVEAGNMATARCLEPYPGEVSSLTKAQKAQVRACTARLAPSYYRAAKTKFNCR